jgi:hypothetical protein
LKKAFLFLFFLITSFTSSAQDIDLVQFAKLYFDAWKATQAPDATMKDIEHYLSFLKDDVGHQHLPYDTDSARLPTGKEDMRSGMSFYLGAQNIRD